MAKTKPVVETTTTKKGGTMTEEVALTQLMLDYNRYQEYKKDNDQKYNFVSKQQMNAFAKRLREDEIKDKFRYPSSFLMYKEKMWSSILSSIPKIGLMLFFIHLE